MQSERVCKKKEPSDSCDALLDIAAQNLLIPQDDQAKMGEVYAAKLRKMTPEQQLYADRFINDILFEGQLGNLHRDSIILRRSRASTPYSQHSPMTADSETRFTFTSGENVAIPMSQRSGLGNTAQSSGEQYMVLPVQRSQVQHFPTGTIADNSQETAAAYFMNFAES